MERLKPCPFCGEVITPLKSSLSICKLNDGTFALNHFCESKRKCDVGVAISIYGDSEDEVIESWNRRASDEEDMQNL